MPSKNNGSGTFYESTQSICPQCRRVIDAEITFRDNRVYMRKQCPEHGPFEALVFGDAEIYAQLDGYRRPGTPPLQFATAEHRGCPYDCGMCPQHQQHACVGLMEINNACNLDCPLCCASAGTQYARTGFELSFEQVNFMLDRFVAAEGKPEVLQFSGGEPTLHPRLLDFIELAQDKGIAYVMVNTNGIRIARDDRFLAGLARLKPHVYLQFDGFASETSRILRGRPDLVEVKLRALDRLAEADVRVVLVTAVERGVNDHELGAIVEFGMSHPAVFGITFQPAFHAQRHLPVDPMQRMTIPDVLNSVEAQTNRLFRLSDFVPVPCCSPTCSFVTYALLDGDRVTPLPRVLPVERCLDFVQNRTLPGLSDSLVQLLERLWSASAAAGSEQLARRVWQLVNLGAQAPALAGLLSARHIANALAPHGNGSGAPTRAGARCPSCHSHLPLDTHTPRDLARHIFMVNTRDFMDPWMFNVKNLVKCCIAVLVPDGRAIPFCAYNSLGYREQIVGQLMRDQARVHAHG